MIEDLKDLNGIPNGAVIEKIISYTDDDVKEGEFKDEFNPFRLVIETDKGIFAFEGCRNRRPIVYVVGKVDQDDNKRWEFQGVFDDEKKAVKECKDEFYFVGPVKMNVSYPEEAIEWPGLYYPIIKTKHLIYPNLNMENK